MGTDFLIDDRDPNQRDENMNMPRTNTTFLVNNENSMGQSDFNYKLDSRENSNENNFFGVPIKTTFKESGFNSQFNEPPVRSFDARIRE
jgi:hypothetical protein